MAVWLREHGIDSVRWHELGHPEDSDEDILDWCRRHEACLVSQDADFAKILRESKAVQPSVIHLRDCNPVALETYAEQVLVFCCAASPPNSPPVVFS